MPGPEQVKIERAAKALSRLSGVHGLEGGVLVFLPDWRAHWCKLGGEPGGIGDVEARVPPPSAYGSQEELLEACRLELDEALYARSSRVARTLPDWFELTKERGDDPSRLFEMVDWLSDDVEAGEWRERLEREWPRDDDSPSGLHLLQ
jgi:hypothetical protein